MRYKIISFYFPLHYINTGLRIHHFEMDGAYHEKSFIITKLPGDSYSDDVGRDYTLIEGSNGVYRAYRPALSTGAPRPTSWFIKIVSESDPKFNFDIAHMIGSMDELFDNRDQELYSDSIVPLFLEREIIQMKDSAKKIQYKY